MGKKLEIVTINPMDYCQNRCVYCGEFKGEIRELYDPLPIIREFIDQKMVAENCLFDWGGGEPTLSRYFEDTFLFLLEHGYMQRINTNAVKLSEVILEHLDDRLVSMRVSLDAGNEKAFLAMKGRNLFHQVVNNIREYRRRTRNIVLKYVVICTNSDWESIEDFVRLAVDNTVPSRDFNEIKSIEELNKGNEQYEIPKKLLPVHLKRIREYENGIVPVVLASFETLLSIMKDMKIILYGAGKNRRELYECLKTYHMNVCAVCDKYKQGRYWRY